MNNFNRNEIAKPNVEGSAVNSTKDVFQILQDKLKIACGYELTNEEKLMVGNISDIDQMKSWFNQKLVYQTFSSDPELVKILPELNILDIITDPLNMKAEDAKLYTNPEMYRNLVYDKWTNALQKIKKALEVKITQEFIRKRDLRRTNGELDVMLNERELRIINSEVSETVDKLQKILPGMQGDKLKGAIDTFLDYNVDLRYRYDAYKELVCNDFGITPESFDEWFNAIQSENMNILDTEGVTSRTQLQKTGKFMDKYKHLLKKVPNWKKGDIVWRSEFIKNVDAVESEEVAKSIHKSSNEAKNLFEAMKKLYHRIDEPVRERDINKSIGTKEQRDNFINRRKTNKLKDRVKEESRIKDEPKPVEEAKPVAQTSTVNLKDFVRTPEGIEEKVEEVKETKFVMEFPEEIDYELKLKWYLDKVKSGEFQIFDVMVHDKTGYIRFSIDEGYKIGKYELRDKKFIDMFNDFFDDKKPVEEDKPIIDEDFVKENLYSKEDYFETRYSHKDSSKEDFEKLAERKQFDADPKVLRISNPIERIRAYKESAKDGRLLFLVNSNYEVFVKKIKLRDKISYMLSLISQTRDVETVDSAIKLELLKVIYDCVEFPSFEEEPTFIDFIKCLSDADLTVLIMMIAIVNTPENEEGKIPLNVTSVVCTKPGCESVGFFKEPITLDLKEEFKSLYPIEIYKTNYPKYKMAGYKNIYQAYRNSIIGEIREVNGSDDDLNYSLLISLPTVWKKQQVKSVMDFVMYRLVADEYAKRVISASGELYENAKPVHEYMSKKTFTEFRYDYTEIQFSDDEESKDEETKAIARTLSVINDEMTEMRSSMLPFILVLDVIDEISVSTKSGESVVSNLTLDDAYTLINIIKEMPTKVLSEIVDVKNGESDGKLIPAEITYSAEELAGRFDFDEYYRTDEEVSESIRQRLLDRGSDEEFIDKTIKESLAERATVRERYNKEGICMCGGREWKVNYTAILFFSMSKVLELQQN